LLACSCVTLNCETQAIIDRTKSGSEVSYDEFFLKPR
jgi:hypothetical protein